MNSVIKSFFYGVVSASLALVAQLTIFSFMIDTGSPSDLIKIETLPLYLFIAVLAEEIPKILFAYYFLIPISKTGIDLIANAFIAGIGFAFFEISLFIVKYTSPTQTDYFEIVKIGLLHISTFGIAAYFSALAQKKSTLFILAIIITASLHFTFNFSITQEGSLFQYIPVGVLVFSALINIYHLSIINKKLAISK